MASLSVKLGDALLEIRAERWPPREKKWRLALVPEDLQASGMAADGSLFPQAAEGSIWPGFGLFMGSGDEL